MLSSAHKDCQVGLAFLQCDTSERAPRFKCVCLVEASRLAAGDTVKKLLWRMKNGEVPLKKEPRVAVVLIGTEDLVSPACVDPIVAPRTAAELRGLLVYMHR